MTKEKLNKGQEVDQEEKARRNRLFWWAIVVIIVNAIMIYTPNFITRSASMLITAYALYRVVVWDNKKNRYSRKYYDRAGKPLDKPREGQKVSNWFK